MTLENGPKKMKNILFLVFVFQEYLGDSESFCRVIRCGVSVSVDTKNEKKKRIAMQIDRRNNEEECLRYALS